MRILITGHTGFLGSNLTLNLLNKHHRVVGLDLKKTSIFSNYKNFSQYKINLLSLKKVYSLFKKLKKIDILVHVAAKQPIKKDTKFNKYLKTNFYGTKNLAEACRDCGVKKIIFCSSFSVYGDKKSPIKENTLPDPRNTYGLSKYLSENLLQYFANQFNINVIILRFDGIYGKDQNLPGFMKMSFEYAIKNKQVLLFNMGKLKRDHVYVIDAVKAINLAIKKINKFKFEIFNIGGKNPTSAFNIFKKIKKICKSRSKIILSKKKLNFSQDVFLDISKAKNLLQFKPDSLDNNLKKMFQDVK
jgi:UDP-glucose 4-epimerase|tara:strand:+ start:1773 stop:2675 length:903 start_codon:yes stop_codon:yes gene_type:complete